MEAQECHKCRLGQAVLTSTKYEMKQPSGVQIGSRDAIKIARVECWRCAVCGHQWELPFVADGAAAG